MSERAERKELGKKNFSFGRQRAEPIPEIELHPSSIRLSSSLQLHHPPLQVFSIHARSSLTRLLLRDPRHCPTWRYGIVLSNSVAVPPSSREQRRAVELSSQPAARQPGLAIARGVGGDTGSRMLV